MWTKKKEETHPLMQRFSTVIAHGLCSLGLGENKRKNYCESMPNWGVFMGEITQEVIPQKLNHRK